MDRQTPPRRRAGLTPPLFLASVRGRIVFGFALLVLILVTVVAVSAWLARDHRAELAEMEGVASAMTMLEDAKGGGSTTFALLQLYLASGDEGLVEGFSASQATAFEKMSEASAIETSLGHDDEVESLKRTKAASASLFEKWERAIALRASGDASAATVLMQSTIPAAREVGAAVDAVLEEEHRELSAGRQDADRTAELALWFAAIAGAAGAALGLAVSFIIARSILRPLSSLESAALAVAHGDLEARAPVAGPRELARLGASLNQMTEALLDASKRRELEAEREAAFAALRESEVRHRTLLSTAA